MMEEEEDQQKLPDLVKELVHRLLSQNLPPKSTKQLDLGIYFPSRDKLCLIPTPDFPYAPYHSIRIDPHDPPTSLILAMQGHQRY